MSVLRTGTPGNDNFSNRFHANPIGFGFGDTLAGGAGDDFYYITFRDPVTSPPVVIVEAEDDGWDTVIFGFVTPEYAVAPPGTAIESYLMSPGIEAASVDGDFGASYHTIVGNGLGNLITIGGRAERLAFNTALGGAGDDLLTGQVGKISLDGQDGDDLLRVLLNQDGGSDFEAIVVGGSGIDTLLIQNVNPNAGLRVSLAAQAGEQTLPGGSKIVATGIENVWVAGGGDGADTLTGNGAANMLIASGGNDSLNGGNGDDSLFGDFPPDIGMIRDMRLDNVLGPSVYELGALGGDDTLLGGNGDDMLVGGSFDDRLLGGDGNDLLLGGYAPPDDSLADRWISQESYLFFRQYYYSQGQFYWADGADTLYGGAGADTLDGGAGADRMFGETGDDTYILDNSGDRAIEGVGAGFDTVLTHLATTRLAAHLEALTLLDGAVSGFGNAEANRITGNAGNNRLDGGDGADTLIGGLGNDTLIGGLGADLLAFAAPTDVLDRVIGFVSGEDRLGFSAAGFGGGLVEGENLAARFFAHPLPGGTPLARFIYDQPTGRLWWDANGSIGGQRVQIAALDPGTALAAADLVMIA